MPETLEAALPPPANWPPMLYIGGAPGAGKSTLARALARAHDLPLHPVDLWTYDHALRMPWAGSLDEELARGPEAAADAFEAASRGRLELVLADIGARGLGVVPAVVEGPQLTPALAGPLPSGWGVWLLPDPERTRLARAQRLAREQRLGGGGEQRPASEQRPAGGQQSARRSAPRPSRTARLVQRDAVLAGRIRRAAARAGWPTIDVPAHPDWAAVAAAVESALAPALRDAPRLEPGAALSRQRRLENAAAVRQGLLWQQAAGLATLPGYRFACECGGSGCRATWLATPDGYQARTAGRPLVAHPPGAGGPVSG